MSRFWISLLIATLFFAGTGLVAYCIRRQLKRRNALKIAHWLWAELGKRMRTGTPKEQFDIVLRLRRLGKSIIPFLVEQWTRNPNVCLADYAWSALWGIASPRTPELIPVLLNMLEDHNSRIRYHTIRILEQIGKKAGAAVPQLREIMEEDEDMNAQAAAIIALKAITGIRA
jgi:hypothetical protein